MPTYNATFTRTASGTSPSTVSLSTATGLASVPASYTSGVSSLSIPAVAPLPASQGTIFSFNGIQFAAKNLKVKRTQSYADVTTLDRPAGSTRVLQAVGLADGDQITCEYFGTTAPARGVPGVIACQSLNVTGNAVCEDFELTAVVGELLTGNATFRITG